MSRLPVISDPARAIRPSRASRWRAASLVTLHLLIAAHITHWLVTGRSVTPVEPSEAMAFTNAGMINAGVIFFAATILLTALFGRYLCGWACHLVALQDLSRWLLARVGIRPRPLRSRLLRWVPFLAFAYMFLWPLIYRWSAGDRFDELGLELTTSEFWATFPGWWIGGLTFLVCGFLIVYLLGAKGFCSFACPYGAAFGAVDRLAPFRIRVTDACEGCGHCTAVCTSNVRVHEEVRTFGMVVDSGCMKCRDCVSVCPNDALYYGPGPIPRLGQRSAARSGRRRGLLRWWEEVLLAVAFAAAFFTFRGLYGVVPFLFSLGLAAILAYLVLLSGQLLTQPHVARNRIQLKRQGRLRPAGWVFAVAMALVGSFWAHSALVRWHDWSGGKLYRATRALRLAALEEGRTYRSLQPGERELVRRTLHRLEIVERIGLFPTIGNQPSLAWLYLVDGSSGQLARTAAAAISQGDEPALMQILLGRDAENRDDPAAAMAAYRRAVEEAPELAIPYLRLGTLLAQHGELGAALEIFDQGRRRVPDSADLVYNAALARAFQGEADAAVALFEQALEIDPSHRQARENLAGLLATVSRYEESIAHYRAALIRWPDDPDTHVLLAQALMAIGDLEGARAEIDAALEIAPSHPAAVGIAGELAAGRPPADDTSMN